MTQTDIVANHQPLRHRQLRVRTGPKASLSFRADIEGLRAVAVGLVVANHAAPSIVPGGFIGVDIFFVTSGFLITRLILDERARSGRFCISEFYARRVRRLLPAASVVILATTAASYLFLGPAAGDRVAGDAKWAAGFVANIHFSIVESSESGASLPISPLYTLWSLGVEEQFYLVWPALFAVAIAIGGVAHQRASLETGLVLIITSSLAWAIIQTPLNANWAYESPLTRAWELAVGALLAVMAPWIAKTSSRPLVNLVALVGISAIMICAFALGKHTPYPGFAALLPVVGAAAFIAAGGTVTRPVTERLLAIRPVQWLGARSYSLYLWHWPILTVASQHYGENLPPAAKIALVLAAVAAADASYRLLENPIRHSQFLQQRPRCTLVLGAVLVATTMSAAQLMIVLTP